MKIVVIDGQGGGIGKMLIEALKREALNAELFAIGTNSAATANMLRAGADKAATGENAVKVACRTADVIVGPVGIAIADSLLGEITPEMAAAVGASLAKKVLIPVNLCDNLIVGVQDMPMAQFVALAVKKVLDTYSAHC